MAQVKATIIARKRWFFWPCVLCMMVGYWMGWIRECDRDRCSRWLANNAMKIEVK